jgi:hypothetical protein
MRIPLRVCAKSWRGERGAGPTPARAIPTGKFSPRGGVPEPGLRGSHRMRSYAVMRIAPVCPCGELGRVRGERGKRATPVHAIVSSRNRCTRMIFDTMEAFSPNSLVECVILG